MHFDECTYDPKLASSPDILNVLPVQKEQILCLWRDFGESASLGDCILGAVFAH